MGHTWTRAKGGRVLEYFNPDRRPNENTPPGTFTTARPLFILWAHVRRARRKQRAADGDGVALRPQGRGANRQGRRAFRRTAAFAPHREAAGGLARCPCPISW
jgi:hypothetical protein